MADEETNEDQEETTDNTDDILHAIRRHKMAGRPEVAAQLRSHLDAGTNPPNHLVYESKIRPRKYVEGSLEVPPRSGQNATKAAWVDFAKTTTDTDDAVLKKMGRDDIIEMLEDQGVIPAEEEEGDS